MPSQNCHILLVDDHVESLYVLERLLRNCNYTVQSAHSFAEAMATARGRRFDLVISDVGLPDRSGLELMKELRLLWDVKGIALSGFTDDQDIRASKLAGFARHMSKPVVFEDLLAAIREVADWCPPTEMSSNALCQGAD
jgi:CheY-like chemotaxis protein